MKKLLGKLISLLGCMTILLFLAGVFFGIFLENQDTAGFLGATGAVAGLIFIFSGLIYTSLTTGQPDSDKNFPR